MALPPFGYKDDEDPEIRLDLLNSSLENAVSEAPGPAPIQAPVQVAPRALDNTQLENSYEYGVSAPARLQQSLASAGLEAKAADYREQAALANQTAMDRLQQALESQPTISPSQGFAAALLASIPSLGGFAFRKSLGSPKIPEGTYFPGMSGQDFSETFGAGGDAFAADAMKIGGDAAGGYLEDLTKQQAKTPGLLKEMSDLERQRSLLLENKASSLDQAGLQQQGIDERQRQEHQFREEQSRLNREARERNGPADPLAGYTEAQKAAIRAKNSGIDANNNPFTPPAKPYSPSVGMTKDIATSRALALSAWDIAQRVPTNFQTWAELTAARSLSAVDQGTVVRSLNDFVDRIARGRSGAAITPQEYEKLKSFVAGDGSLSPLKVQEYLKSYAKDTMFMAENVKESAEMLHDPERSKTMFQLPGDANGAAISKQQQFDAIDKDPSLTARQKAEAFSKL